MDIIKTSTSLSYLTPKSTIEDTYQWSKDIIGEVFAQMLKDQQVDGSSLLTCKAKDFTFYGMPLDLATKLEAEIQKSSENIMTIPSEKLGSVSLRITPGDIITLSGLKFELQKVLRITNISTVWKAINLEQNTDVVIKEMPRNDLGDQSYENEVEVLKTLNNLNRTPKYYLSDISHGSYQVELSNFIVIEFIPSTTSELYYKNNVISENEAIQFLEYCLQTLTVIHSHNIIHVDLNPNNILIHNDTKEPWIIDFGSAIKIGQEPFTWTERFVGPEIRLGLGKYSDIFSLGATLISNLHLPKALTFSHWGEVVEICPFSDQLKSVLYKMVERNYTNRFQNCEKVLAALSGNDLSDDLQQSPINPQQWSIEETYEWVATIIGGTHGKAEALKLKNHQINGSALLNLTYSDLRNLGLVLGPARKLENAIKELSEQFSSKAS